MIYVPLFTDLTPIVIEFVSTELPAYHIAEDLKGWAAPQKWVTIQPTGGTVVQKVRSIAPRYDVNVYGPTKPVAMDMALEAIQSIYKMRNYKDVLTGVVITNVETTLPADISDPINSNPRFVFDATITFRTP